MRSLTKRQVALLSVIVLSIHQVLTVLAGNTVTKEILHDKTFDPQDHQVCE